MPKKEVPLLTAGQIKYMTDRFLGWYLPKDFRPDCGINFKPGNPPHPGPSGTNLFDAGQAEAMVRYMVEGMPGNSAIVCVEAERLARMEAALRDIAAKVTDYMNAGWRADHLYIRLSELQTIAREALSLIAQPQARTIIGTDDTPLVQPCPHCDKPIIVDANQRAQKFDIERPTDSRPCLHPIHGTTCGYPESACMHEGSTYPKPPAGRHKYQPEPK